MNEETISEEIKVTASSIVKMFKNVANWGPDMKNHCRVVDGNLEVVDTFYYGGDKALANLVNE